jgi:predicted nucleotidyltransferase
MRVKNKSELFAVIANHKAELQRLGLKRVGVFGSFARGDQTEQSDVDMLVEFDPLRKNFDNFMATAIFLENTLGRKVELMTPESLSPHFAPFILREVEYASISS